MLGAVAGEVHNREWHIVTCEYPPKIGGVADYTFQIANSLNQHGIRAIVWAPGNDPVAQTQEAITVNRCFGHFRPQELAAINRLWKSAKSQRRILLQWTPTGYGLKSANLPFCLWLAWRVSRGDELVVIFHEAFFSLSEHLLRRRAAALVQRLMTILLLNAAVEVFVSTSYLAKFIAPYCFRKTSIKTLPMPANFVPREDREAITKMRLTIASIGEPILGHFGLYSPHVESLLIPSLLKLLRNNLRIRVVLIGGGSTHYRERLLLSNPEFSTRIRATGPCSHDEASIHISACDAMFQPYLEGLTTRRSTTMAALAHGRCLVSTFGSKTEDIWKSTSAVYFLRSWDPAHIAEEIEGVLASPEQTARQGREGLMFYEQNFALSRTIDKLLATGSQ
jgi:glycosyltransferase involved in cell wall biosynthesis